jgi:putative ABC transport system permease protein
MNKHNPPKLPLRFFRWFCHQDYREDIEGDLVERFERRIEEKGARKAKWLFVWEVLRLFRPSIVRSILPMSLLKYQGMLYHFIKNTFRSFVRRPASTALTFMSFVPAFIACVVLFIYLSQQLSYDNFHTEANNIYRVSTDGENRGVSIRSAFTQFPLGPAMKEEIPGIKNVVRLSRKRSSTVYRGEEVYKDLASHYADPSFFEVLDIALIHGDRAEVLREPNSIVLSQSTARKIFGEANPIGQTLEGENQHPLMVTGVFEDVPNNSHLKIDALFSLTSPLMGDINRASNWGKPEAYTYVMLDDNASLESIQSGLDEIQRRYLDEMFAKHSISMRYELLNVQDIYLRSTYGREANPGGNIDYVHLFMAIGICLLLIATANYVNLTTAIYTKRLHEIRIRRVIGESRYSLFFQLITESTCFIVLSLALSFLIAMSLLPVVNSRLELELAFSDIANASTLINISVIALLIILLSSIYPAIYLSSFKMIQGIKSKSATATKGIFMRQGLVTFQFAISIFMLIGTITIYEQMQYMRDKDLGFKPENLIQLFLTDDTKETWGELKNGLDQNSHVLSIGTASMPIGIAPRQGLPSKLETESGAFLNKNLSEYSIGYDFLPTMSMDLVEGRNFSQAHVSDIESSVIVNETLVREMNWLEPIGKRIRTESNSSESLTVVGVVKDFTQQSLRNSIEPLMLQLSPVNSFAYIKLDDNSTESIIQLEALWNNVNPNFPFEYTFMDQRIFDFYASERKAGTLFWFFSLLTISTSLIGLVGLAAFSTQQYIREISIRKVLGAGNIGLFYILIKDFSFPIALSAIVGCMVVARVASLWFQNFAYHIEISHAVFVLVPVVVLLLAVITTSYHTASVVFSNPASNLKHE